LVATTAAGGGGPTAAAASGTARPIKRHTLLFFALYNIARQHCMRQEFRDSMPCKAYHSQNVIAGFEIHVWPTSSLLVKKGSRAFCPRIPGLLQRGG
jgi:hypothetical protein